MFLIVCFYSSYASPIVAPCSMDTPRRATEPPALNPNDKE